MGLEFECSVFEPPLYIISRFQNVVCAYGGGSKWEQSKSFDAGAEIAIATPGRMIDMIKMKVTNLERVTYLVLDEVKYCNCSQAQNCVFQPFKFRGL